MDLALTTTAGTPSGEDDCRSGCKRGSEGTHVALGSEDLDALLGGKNQRLNKLLLEQNLNPSICANRPTLRYHLANQASIP